jgi:hypothetical protein
MATLRPVARWIQPPAAVSAALFLGAQLIRPPLAHPPVTADLEAPPAVKAILRRSCYDCHSNETRLRWFDEVVPAYWLVVRDVREGRARLDFSDLGARPAAGQRAALYEAVSWIALGAMPPGQYTALHRDARVTPEELAILKDYLRPPRDGGVAVRSAAAPAPLPRHVADVQPAPNGLGFPSGYMDWQPISTTERFDNDTLRLIAGNEIAVHAIAEGRVHPWPDGATFAKVAWIPSVDGHAVRFKQVEFMVKDAQRYATTEGWGFGRWLGYDLKPYGADAGFATECTGCHKPMKKNDYVYTLPIKTLPGPDDVFNAQAALPDGLTFDPLSWRFLTTSVDESASTMTTLYANGPALQHARSGAPGPYPAGAALAWVTWARREDPHWFGARIPGPALAIERVTVSASADGEPSYAYDRFTGSPAVKSPPLDGTALRERAGALLAEVPLPSP